MLTLDQVKSKSSARFIGLHPVVLAAATALIERCYARGVPILITQGLRTIAEQNALYEQGRTKPGAIVTNARGGYSYHNFGMAVDFALLLPNGSSVSWDMKLDGNKNNVADWQEVVQEAKKLGLEWGGDWTSFKDYPHFQMVFGLTLTQLRAGRKPSETAMAKALANIDRQMKEADELSAEDKKELTALRSEVKALSDIVAGLTNSKDVLKEQSLKQAVEIKEMSAILLELTNTTPPVWSQEALQAFACTPSVLNNKPVIDTPESATYAEARLITILHRLGLAAQQKGDK